LRGFDSRQRRATPQRHSNYQRVRTRSILMMDVAMLAIGIVFFALSIAYVYACDLL
jgi:hypothetical protein